MKLKPNSYNAENYVFISFGSGPVQLIPTNPDALETYKYKFNGKELQDELGLNVYDFGARNYMPDLGRWMNTDFLAEHYYSESPYSYALNNPVVYIDPDGMRVDVSELFKSEEGIKTAINTLLDLSEQTGLSLSIKNTDNRFTMEYAKDEDGNAVISESDGVQLGSSEARNQLTKLIDNPNTVNVALGHNNIGSKGGSNSILLDPIQINSHIDNVTQGLNSKTLGYGMTFLHESYHTRIGGGLKDTDKEYVKGPTVEKMNTIRQQLDNNPLNRILGNGTQYGERKYYMGTEVSRLPYPGIKNLSTIRSTIHFNIRNDRGNKVNAGTITQYVKRNDKN